MAPFVFLLVTTLLVVGFFRSSEGLFFTVVNNCRFTIWPGIQPSANLPTLAGGGFELKPLTHVSFDAPNQHWAGRIWARTKCRSTPGGFRCGTGDCGGSVHCNGAGGVPPATLAEFSVHHGNDDLSSYGVSLVDGFNLPMTITPHEGKGTCPVVGCKVNLLQTCPPELRVSVDGVVAACKSGCEAFKRDELCCRGQFNSPQKCGPSTYSKIFKRECPATFTYAHDTPSLLHDCSSPRELKVIFCH